MSPSLFTTTERVRGRNYQALGVCGANGVLGVSRFGDSYLMGGRDLNSTILNMEFLLLVMFKCHSFLTQV